MRLLLSQFESNVTASRREVRALDAALSRLAKKEGLIVRREQVIIQVRVLPLILFQQELARLYFPLCTLSLLLYVKSLHYSASSQ